MLKGRTKVWVCQLWNYAINLIFSIVAPKWPQTWAQMLTIAWCQQFCVCVFCVDFFFFFCPALYVNVLYCTTVSLPFTCDEWGPWIIFGLTKYWCVWLREALPPDINLYENMEIKGVCLTNGLFFFRRKKGEKKELSHGLRRCLALRMVTKTDNAVCSCFFTWLAVQICWSLTNNWHENEISCCDLFGSKLFTYCHVTELTETHAGELMSWFWWHMSNNKNLKGEFTF